MKHGISALFPVFLLGNHKKLAKMFHETNFVLAAKTEEHGRTQ